MHLSWTLTSMIKPMSRAEHPISMWLLPSEEEKEQHEAFHKFSMLMKCVIYGEKSTAESLGFNEEGCCSGNFCVSRCLLLDDRFFYLHFRGEETGRRLCSCVV